MLGNFKALKNRILFGSTSGIITNLALIAGLEGTENAKMNIIASILVIAIADNVSDSLGIHIYQEAEGLNKSEVWFSFISNFLSRFIVSAVFLLIVYFLPMDLAVIVASVYGLFVLSFLSYKIAIHRGIKPAKSIIEHLAIAVTVIILSTFLSNWIGKVF